jgi:hypothetical protein
MVRCIVLLPIVFVFGCGLADYEAHMLESQKRAERFDEETRLLGPPLEMPTTKRPPPAPPLPQVEITVKMLNLALRPPKGINPTFEPKLKGRFYQYTRLKEKAPTNPVPPGQPNQPQPGQPVQPQVAPQPNPAGGGNTSATEGVTEILLGWEDKEMDHDKFVQEILAWFSAKPPSPLPVFNVTPPRKQSFTYESYDIADPQDNLFQYRVVIRTKGKVQVAVIYRVQKDKLQQVNRALQLSLESMHLEEPLP